MFSPSIAIAPTESTAGSATGLVTTVRMPDSESSSGHADAESTLKGTTVTLPAGLSLSPSAANGLQACSQEQFGLHTASVPSCPDASKLGSVQIRTPLLAQTLEGNVYVAEQDNNPFASVLAIYLAAEGGGALVKLAGHVSANPATGQLTSTFSETPELPFSSLKLELWSGPRAALVSPQACGSYLSEASFEAWAGLAPVRVFSPFATTSGCTGGFSPAFTAGTTDSRAGSYAPFVLSLSRADAEQEPSAITLNMPPGLLANISSVPQCPQAQAAAGDCPEASRVGSVQASAGPGSDPLVLDGSAYLTGPYNGGPFGLAVEVPAIAGPFDLGTVVVRSSIRIDPTDAHVTVVSDAFPSVLDVTGSDGQTDGFPVHLRGVTVTIDRPSFTLNPTSCQAKTIAATLSSSDGASVSKNTPFQATGCAALTFAPALSASAAAQGSKTEGSAFEVTVRSGGLDAEGAAQAGIAKVDLQLPAQLVSRLSTLQQACPAATFEANPASCDEGSLIGQATIHTPILNSPLTGPAYLVSHGGEAFPDVEFVLQGENITLILDGKTDIKNGITYSKFESNPDAPFTTFEAVLPAGPHSALAPNVPENEHYNLCKQTLTMPTTIEGQNGAVIEHATPITLTGGCTNVLPAKTHKPTRQQQLNEALAKCRKTNKHKPKKRAACETNAHKHYAQTATTHPPHHHPHK